MAKKWNKAVNKTVLRLLTWLGIGSTSILFMACYGPAPQSYQVVEDEDSIVVMMGDSVAVSVDMASNDEVVMEDSLETAE